MISTLTWKEVREHRGIWLTMVVMTVVLGLGLGRIVALGDAHAAIGVGAMTILAMGVAYGVVCGAMMFAGEIEGGTLVFLDVFHGRREVLWLGKFVIGAVLALTQGLAVALAMRVFEQQLPGWTLSIIGRSVVNPRFGAVPADSGFWFLVLPILTFEAFAWGLLASSLTRRVLGGAAAAAVGVTLVWLVALCAPPAPFFVVRLLLVAGLLVASLVIFQGQQREGPMPMPEPVEPRDPRKAFLDLWEEFERADEDIPEVLPVDELPPRVAVAYVPTATDRSPSQPPSANTAPSSGASASTPLPAEVLWWLTLQQAWVPVTLFVLAGLPVGFLFVAVNPQVCWPLATLLLGVACGTAAFAPEQRDLSYQFLAAQHLPLQVVWRFKTLFWLVVAILGTLAIALGASPRIFLQLMAPARPQNDVFGTLAELMGPTLFVCVWLFYGFGTGQLFVWLCRKNILALLVSSLVAMAALGLWLPSLVCGGMGGWQLWVLPLMLLATTWGLMRAWAGGRIWERKPIAALVGVGTAAVIGALLNYGCRAWEVPDVGEPLDRQAFRAKLPAAKDNTAAKLIQQAITSVNDAQERWRAPMTEAVGLPAGVLEMPRADGQASLLSHLPACKKLAAKLAETARASEPSPAFDRLAEVLALSRTLRNKAPLESYLAGIEVEEIALRGVEQWVGRGKPPADLLRRVLGELNRHAKETPAPLDCLETACFGSAGLVANPSAWTFAAPGPGQIPERWLAGGIALSLDTPWEAERKTRLWQLVWAGLFRAVETPHWELPEITQPVPTPKPATRRILDGWLPAAEGPGSGISREQLARLLDASWLADERLFCPVVTLRDSASRARWQVDALRQAVALGLYQLDQGKPAPNLQAVAPKYFPASLPTDPFTGESFQYRVTPPNEPQQAGGPVPGQGILWSSGPGRIELTMLAPHWPQ